MNVTQSNIMLKSVLRKIIIIQLSTRIFGSKFLSLVYITITSCRNSYL